MGCGLLLGFLGGVALAKLARAFWWHRHGYGHGGGCGPSAGGCEPEAGCGPGESAGGGHGYGPGAHCGHGGRGWGGGWGGWGRRRWSGPFRLFWLARELDLDARQREEAMRIFADLRRSFAGLKEGREQAFGTILDALSGESFERSKVDALADEKVGRLGDLKEQVVNGLAALHAILTPEQRARLREIIARYTGGGSGHPYRGEGPAPVSL
jgi:Spy/CpxP family protein refolding chaperone